MMTNEDYHQAVECKVRGTWNLHKASRDQPLDFFTMLSSISGVVGNKGQANYAAANAFLDAFAHYRQAQGLPANSVDLGAIEDVGYIAEQGSGLEARFDKKQWTPINEGTLRRILTYSILQQSRYSPLSASSSAQLITGVTFPLPNDGSSELMGEARFGYLFNSSSNAVIGDEEGGNTKDAADQAIRAFRLMRESGADDATVLKAIVQLVSAQVSRVLRLETEVEPGKPLQAYGLDSLSAVELRGWVRTKLGAELSTLDITNARSLYALCEKVLASLPQLKADPL
jgi:acyl carrier protein